MVQMFVDLPSVPFFKKINVCAFLSHPGEKSAADTLSCLLRQVLSRCLLQALSCLCRCESVLVCVTFAQGIRSPRLGCSLHSLLKPLPAASFWKVPRVLPSRLGCFLTPKALEVGGHNF